MIFKSCLRCEKRHHLCHSTCEEYQEERARFDEMRARRDEKIQRDILYKDARFGRKRR